MAGPDGTATVPGMDCPSFSDTRLIASSHPAIAAAAPTAAVVFSAARRETVQSLLIRHQIGATGGLSARASRPGSTGSKLPVAQGINPLRPAPAAPPAGRPRPQAAAAARR